MQSPGESERWVDGGGGGKGKGRIKGEWRGGEQQSLIFNQVPATIMPTKVKY